MLCTNDKLPEVRHVDQDFKGLHRGSRTGAQGSVLRKVWLGAGFVFLDRVDRGPPVGGLYVGWE